jgi:endonuclease/exonuclease/phosphatase family metal-dependent hydrolase
MQKIILFFIIALIVQGCNKKMNDITAIQTQHPVDQAATNSVAAITSWTPADDSWVAVLDITNDKINVYDHIAQFWTIDARLMNWSATTAKGYSAAEASAWGDPRDVRLRMSPWGGVWVAAAGNLATIAIRSTGNRQWAVNTGTGSTPHGVELLPNGNIVVAARDANWVRIYNSSQGSSSTGYTQFNITAPTAVLWDPVANVIRVTGSMSGTSVLAALTVGGTAAAPTLTENTSLRSTLPTAVGQDVTDFAGDGNKLWVCTNTGVYTYNKTTKAFTAIGSYAFRSGVKACVNQISGRLIQASPANAAHIDFCASTGVWHQWQNLVGTSNYRVRIWKYDYVTEAPGPVMKVMTYNIKLGNGSLQQIANVINAQNPDLICLQEVDSCTNRSGSTINQAKELGRLTKRYYYFSRAMPYDGGTYGDAILSRWPMYQVTHYPLPAGNGEPRQMAVIRVEKDGTMFNVAGTHLDHLGPAAGNTLLQATAINNIVTGITYPFLLGGDFNSIPSSTTIAKLKEQFTLGCTSCPPTSTAVSPTRSIDYFMYKPGGFSIVSYNTINTQASDHLPVVAEIQLAP